MVPIAGDKAEEPGLQSAAMMDAGGRMGWRKRVAEAAQRWAARRAARARPSGPPVWPEPRIGGDPARGRRLLEGRLRIGPEVIEAPGRSLWDLAPELPEAAALHGMEWLDDLAALGDARARTRAQAWVGDWVARFGGGTGPGWTPELAAGRLLRLLGHARFLLHSHRDGAALARAVAAHAAFLERRWRRAPAGTARLLALLALLEAQLSLPGRRTLAERARDALGREAAAVVDPNGAVASRNPEELLEVMGLLVGAEAALSAAELPSDPAIGAALARAAPTLRALRHADGGLARFHGGCRGGEGQVDQVLAAAGRPTLTGTRPALLPQMGFLRLAAGRTTMIVDAAPPPAGAASLLAHASTLALEITSGRRPLVVSCGPGQDFGPRWRRAARATASHSTLSLDDVSSARLAPPRPGESGARLIEGPRRVVMEGTAPGPEGQHVELAHDGWRTLHGLTHARVLTLSADGRVIEGDDLLTTLTTTDGALFDRSLEASRGFGLPFSLRFHLHPDVGAEALSDGTVGLALRSGEDWVFSHEGDGALSLEPSVYLERGRLRPRETLQIVVAGRAIRPMTRLRWTLAKGYGTPEGLRDLNPGPAWDEEDE